MDGVVAVGERGLVEAIINMLRDTETGELSRQLLPLLRPNPSLQEKLFSPFDGSDADQWGLHFNEKHKFTLFHRLIELNDEGIFNKITQHFKKEIIDYYKAGNIAIYSDLGWAITHNYDHLLLFMVSNFVNAISAHDQWSRVLSCLPEDRFEHVTRKFETQIGRYYENNQAKLLKDICHAIKENNYRVLLFMLSNFADPLGDKWREVLSYLYQDSINKGQLTLHKIGRLDEEESTLRQAMLVRATQLILNSPFAPDHLDIPGSSPFSINACHQCKMIRVKDSSEPSDNFSRLSSLDWHHKNDDRPYTAWNLMSLAIMLQNQDIINSFLTYATKHQIALDLSIPNWIVYSDKQTEFVSALELAFLICITFPFSTLNPVFLGRYEIDSYANPNQPFETLKSLLQLTPVNEASLKIKRAMLHALLEQKYSFYIMGHFELITLVFETSEEHIAALLNGGESAGASLLEKITDYEDAYAGAVRPLNGRELVRKIVALLVRDLTPENRQCLYKVLSTLSDISITSDDFDFFVTCCDDFKRLVEIPQHHDRKPIPVIPHPEYKNNHFEELIARRLAHYHSNPTRDPQAVPESDVAAAVLLYFIIKVLSSDNNIELVLPQAGDIITALLQHNPDLSYQPDGETTSLIEWIIKLSDASADSLPLSQLARMLTASPSYQQLFLPQFSKDYLIYAAKEGKTEFINAILQQSHDFDSNLLARVFAQLIYKLMKIKKDKSLTGVKQGGHIFSQYMKTFELLLITGANTQMKHAVNLTTDQDEEPLFMLKFITQQTTTKMLACFPVSLLHLAVLYKLPKLAELLVRYNANPDVEYQHFNARLTAPVAMYQEQMNELQGRRPLAWRDMKDNFHRFNQTRSDNRLATLFLLLSIKFDLVGVEPQQEINHGRCHQLMQQILHTMPSTWGVVAQPQSMQFDRADLIRGLPPDLFLLIMAFLFGIKNQPVIPVDIDNETTQPGEFDITAASGNPNSTAASGNPNSVAFPFSEGVSLGLLTWKLWRSCLDLHQQQCETSVADKICQLDAEIAGLSAPPSGRRGGTWPCLSSSVPNVTGEIFNDMKQLYNKRIELQYQWVFRDLSDAAGDSNSRSKLILVAAAGDSNSRSKLILGDAQAMLTAAVNWIDALEPLDSLDDRRQVEHLIARLNDFKQFIIALFAKVRKCPQPTLFGCIGEYCPADGVLPHNADLLLARDCGVRDCGVEESKSAEEVDYHEPVRSAWV